MAAALALCATSAAQAATATESKNLGYLMAATNVCDLYGVMPTKLAAITVEVVYAERILDKMTPSELEHYQEGKALFGEIQERAAACRAAARLMPGFFILN